MQWYLEKYKALKPDDLRHEARILTKLLRAPIHKKKLWAEKRGIWRAQREYIITLINNFKLPKKLIMETKIVTDPKDTLQKVHNLVTLAKFTNNCIDEDLQPIILISLKKVENEYLIVANINEANTIEQVLQAVEHSLIGLKAQANTTPSGIIKNIHG